MDNFSYNNHIFDKSIVNKLIFTTTDVIYTDTNNYYMIDIPNYNKSKYIDNSKLYIKKIDGVTYNDLNVPDLYVNKVIIINNKNKNMQYIVSNLNVQNQYNYIYNYIDFEINMLSNNITIINKLLLLINQSVSKTNILYLIIDSMDKISSHILYFDNFINKIIKILSEFDVKNEMNIALTAKIINIKSQLATIKFFYDNIKTTSIQKISHQESNISKILTYVATIFLPLSFIIAIFSLPVKNVPFKNNENGLYIIIGLVTICAIIGSFYLIELNKRNVFN